MVITDVLRENRHRFPCLLDAERAERYCDRTSLWNRVKAAGCYLLAVGWPLIFSSIFLTFNTPVEVSESYGMLMLLMAMGLLLGGAFLLALCTYPERPCLCVRWLAKPSRWNRLASSVAILGTGLLVLYMLGMALFAAAGSTFFYSELEPAEASQATSSPWAWLGLLAAVIVCFGFFYVYVAWKDETLALFFRVFTAKQLEGWTWRTKWWITQLIGFVAMIALVITSVVLNRASGSGNETPAMATMEFEPFSAIGIVLLYALVNPFIRQVEPQLDELRKLSTFQIGYILAGVALALVLVLSVIGFVPWLVLGLAISLATVAILVASAYLHVMHDRKYFDIILAQEVAA